jgi:hypothetical protein
MLDTTEGARDRGDREACWITPTLLISLECGRAARDRSKGRLIRASNRTGKSKEEGMRQDY